MNDRKKVVITGAAGRIGGLLRSHWGDRYDLRLADITRLTQLAAHEEFVRMDIAEYDQFLSACQNVDTVVHLAADPSPRAEFYVTLLKLNVIGAYNAYEAARQAGCRRVIFASSINAVLGYGSEVTVDWDVPVFPPNVYGATKCWGEALARVYAHQHDLSCICIRLGSPTFDQTGDWDADQPQGSISPRDCAQLVRQCVDVEDLDFAIVHGISNHRRGMMDLEINRRLLGYEPDDGTAFPRAPGP